MQETVRRDFPSCVSRVYENLRMWNLLGVRVRLYVHLCLGVKGESETLCQCLLVPVCGRVLRRDCISEWVYHMCVCVYMLTFNSSLTHSVCVCYVKSLL